MQRGIGGERERKRKRARSEEAHLVVNLTTGIQVKTRAVLEESFWTISSGFDWRPIVKLFAVSNLT